jgi:hypothetical protein
MAPSRGVPAHEPGIVAPDPVKRPMWDDKEIRDRRIGPRQIALSWALAATIFAGLVGWWGIRAVIDGAGPILAAGERSVPSDRPVILETIGPTGDSGAGCEAAADHRHADARC